jgi:hypothetical protein
MLQRTLRVVEAIYRKEAANIMSPPAPFNSKSPVAGAARDTCRG